MRSAGDASAAARPLHDSILGRFRVHMWDDALALGGPQGPGRVGGALSTDTMLGVRDSRGGAQGAEMAW